MSDKQGGVNLAPASVPAPAPAPAPTQNQHNLQQKD